MMAMGIFRKTHLGRGLIDRCLLSGHTKCTSATNDKLLVLGLYSGKGDTNLILVLQLKYSNIKKNPSSFAKVLIAGNDSMSYLSIMSVSYIAYNTFS